MTEGTVTASDGVLIAFERWSGTAGVECLFVHATGFCKELWRPTRTALGSLGADPGGIAIDQRAHGDSGAAPPPTGWVALGDDVATVRLAMDGPVIGVGHSSGGAALCMAEAAAPGSFAGLVLIEPIVFPGPYGRLVDHPLIAGALRRRASFPSTEEARAQFEGKGPFARWTVSALDAYVAYAFRDENGRRVLKCSPETEAGFYREGTNHDTWDRLGDIECPVLVIAGEHSDTHPTVFVEQLVGRFRDATGLIAEGATHLVPMERPDVVASAVAQMV